MTYDALNRAETVVNPSGLGFTFGYDEAGNRKSVVDSDGRETLSAYDLANRLTSRTLEDGATDLRADYAWTDRNELDSVTRFADQAGTSLVGMSAYAYDDGGRLTSLVQTDADHLTIADYQYVYDLNNRLIEKDDNGTVTAFESDPTGQLLAENSKTYAYDENGNRTSQTLPTGPNANRISNDGTWAYTYDANGAVTKRTDTTSQLEWRYTYDIRGQMTGAALWDTSTDSQISSVTYQYDAFGNRIGRDDGTTETTYTLDGWDTAKPAAVGTENFDDYLEESGSDSVVRMFGPGVDQLLGRVDQSGTANWYLPDRQGSVRQVTDSGGGVVATQDYDAFGNVIATTGTMPDGYGYTGRNLDAVTGLQNNRARWYNPETGRWLSEDPLRFAAGDVNLYRYAGNDSINRKDSNGLADNPISSDEYRRNLYEQASRLQRAIVANLHIIDMPYYVDAASMYQNIPIDYLFMNDGYSPFYVATPFWYARTQYLYFPSSDEVNDYLGFLIGTGKSKKLFVRYGYETVGDGFESRIIPSYYVDEFMASFYRIRPRDMERFAAAYGMTKGNRQCSALASHTALRYAPFFMKANDKRNQLIDGNKLMQRSLDDLHGRIRFSFQMDEQFRKDQDLKLFFIAVEAGFSMFLYIAPEPTSKAAGTALLLHALDQAQATSRTIDYHSSVDPYGTQAIHELFVSFGSSPETAKYYSKVLYDFVIPLLIGFTPTGIGLVARAFAPRTIPQGLNAAQFDNAALIIRTKAAHIEGDFLVQGSRATGTARLNSDIDFAIRVSKEDFQLLIKSRFGTPNPCSAKFRTMEHAIRTGKIQAGEAGLRNLRLELESKLGIEVDLSIIRKGGPFDKPPFIHVPKSK